MIHPRIHMVGYADRSPAFIFVAIPNERGRYVRTDKSVALVPCPHCGAQIGEPCLRKGQPGSIDARYGGGTHWTRRSSANARFWGAKPDDIIGTWKAEPIPDEWMEGAA